MAELSFRTIAIAVLVILIAAIAIMFIFSVYSGAESGGVSFLNDSSNILNETKETAKNIGGSFISRLIQR